jgi:hypothetical protein
VDNHANRQLTGGADADHVRPRRDPRLIEHEDFLSIVVGFDSLQRSSLRTGRTTLDALQVQLLVSWPELQAPPIHRL